MTLAKNRDIAEEITQKTFLKAMLSWGKFRNESSELTWLCAVAKNLFLDEMRSHKREKQLIDESERDISIEKNLVDEEYAFKIHMVLHELEEPYKEVFHLRCFGDLSFEKIGRIFGKKETWARVTYHRAKIKIKERMDLL
jgi:RNA polymerase sigma-70 factor (ECF subfamily)